jgi:hypothetical protein
MKILSTSTIQTRRIITNRKDQAEQLLIKRNFLLNDQTDLQNCVADSIHKFLLAPDPSPDNVRELCSAISRFLGKLLEGAPGWSRYYWVDALSHQFINSVAPRAIELTGEIIWGERGQTRQWLDPFFCKAELSGSGNLQSYVLMFADANTGLKRREYGAQKCSAAPTKWLFEFKESTRPNETA